MKQHAKIGNKRRILEENAQKETYGIHWEESP